jgi:uncharacterized protein YggT (Ycf19 family)
MLDELFYARLAHGILTLFMLLLLLRWLGRWIGYDLDESRLRFLARLTDPLLGVLRRALPNMGPFDFAPLAALFLTWVLREFIVSALKNAATGA